MGSLSAQTSEAVLSRLTISRSTAPSWRAASVALKARTKP